MRQSKAWQAARQLPAKVDGKPNKARSDAFREVQSNFRFDSGAIQKFGERCRDACWIGDHLGSHDTQTTTLRAFRAVEQYALGNRGRPRFKRLGELKSVEGKEQAVIRYKTDPLPAVHYSGLVLPLMLDPKDKKGWQNDCLSCPVKYTRIIKRERWYAQLVMEGAAPTKDHAFGDGVVGLDIGPSTIATFSLEQANLETFCPTVVQPWKEVRKIERAMDRSRRASNPDNYNEDRTVKKGSKKWIRSHRYQKLTLNARERERRLASERKRAHGELANQILSQGKTITTEKLSYRSLQKRFGKSVKVRAPGTFVRTLERKAKAAGGQVVEIPTSNTKLSQFDHTTGQYTKKPLSQREHIFGDGVTQPVQRDLYSAFLAFCCIANILDIRQVLEAWPTAEPLLRQAMSGKNQSASGKAQCIPQGISLRADRLSKKEIIRCEAVDVVAQARAIESNGSKPLEPPGFIHGEVQQKRTRQRKTWAECAWQKVKIL